jgi:hypothetical protein
VAKDYTVTPNAPAETTSSPQPTLSFGTKTVPTGVAYLPIRANFAVTVVKALTLTPTAVSLSLVAPTVDKPLVLVPSVGKALALFRSPPNPVPNVAIVALSDPLALGTVISQGSRVADVGIFAPAVLAKVDGIWAVGATSLPLNAFNVNVVKGVKTLEPSPAVFTGSVPTVVADYPLSLATDSSEFNLRVATPEVLVDQLITPNGIATTFVALSPALEQGSITVAPDEATLSHAVPSPSLLMGGLVRQVGPTALTVSVATPLVTEGLGNASGTSLINDGCAAYVVLNPSCPAYCEVEEE